MGQPVIHFEITGKDPEQLQRYFGELFGWEYDTGDPVSGSISDHGSYGFVQRYTAPDGAGIPGGVGGGPAYPGHIVFSVSVPDVEQALAKAESLGGKRIMGPDKVMEGLEIGQFADPEGHVIGLTKAAS